MVRCAATLHLASRRPGSVSACARAALAAAALALSGSGDKAAAQDASRWDGDARSAVRLLAGSSAKDAPLRAAVEIRLKPGWHTYWRYPGDAGVPPRLDFTGSQNVKAVAVSWPAPHAIKEEGLVVIGYDANVVLPLLVEPQTRGQPVTLRLKLDYAVCEKLCVPAEAKVELPLVGGRSSQDGAIAAALARVPRPAALGDAAALAVRSLRRDNATGRPRLFADVAAPPGTPVALFAEGPAPDWALPVPAVIAGAPEGLTRFAFELDGAPPGASFRGAAIMLTAVAGDEAVEVVSRLD
jgi:DsbC/DsbD-like thiol-disulfide interchange protein